MSSFLGGGGGGGGGMAIGNPVSGGTSKSVLFIDGSGNLAQANVNFNYNAATAALGVGSATDPGSIVVGTVGGTITIKTSFVSGSYNISLPTQDGQANMVPTTDGAGNWNFQFALLASVPNGGLGPNEIVFTDASQAPITDSRLTFDNQALVLKLTGGIVLQLAGSSFQDSGYAVDTPSSGGTVDMTNYNPIYTEIVDPAGTLATLTIKLPNLAVDGQILRLKFTQIITALTIIGNTGDSVKGAPTTVALGGLIDCQFTGTAGSGTWYC